MNSSVYLCRILILLGSSLSTNIVSFVDKNKFDENNYAEKFTEAETIYLNFVMPNDLTEDVVCNLSNEKKIELCDIIFHLPHYRESFKIHLNKIPFYKASLQCTDKETLLSYITYVDEENEEISMVNQKMYPCFGRDETVRTSFIEDDYYDTFYLSAGPEPRSVTVYSYIHTKSISKLNVYDFIYNIDLFQLNGLYLKVKDITEELKLMKKIHSTDSEVVLERNYTRYHKYLEKDPICDLPYEKKITLCHIIFSHDMYKNNMKVVINKSANYLLSMNCVTRPVHNNILPVISQIQVRDKQRMYPCHARSKTPVETNFLSDPHVAMFYLSSGHKRNSIFVYIRMKGPNFDEHYTYIDFFENINISYLKPTIITSKELITESSKTYNRIQEIMQYSKYLYEVELLDLVIQSKSNDTTAEYQKFNHLVDAVEEEFNKVVEKAKNGNTAEFETLLSKHKKEKLNPSEFSIPKIKFRRTSSNKYAMENVMEQLLTQIDIFRPELKKRDLYTKKTLDLSNFIQLGPQAYLRLFEKIREDIKYKTSKSSLREKDDLHQITGELGQNLDTTILQTSKIKEILKKKITKLNNEAQKLIKNMEIQARETTLHNIESLAEEISTFRGTATEKDREKKSKSKKKKK